MCIIIDVNAFASVFIESTADHAEFAPVLKWIKSGCGKLIYGGTTYLSELRRSEKYVGFVAELQRARRAVQVDKSIVDREEKRLRKIVDDADFDDPHIIAIVIASMCRIICTKDRRSHRYIQDRGLYPGHIRTPKIYSGKHTSSLLVSRNIAEICKNTPVGERLRRRLEKGL